MSVSNFDNNLRLGFTLAETLIVLVIIGVVSAILIPSLMSKVKDYEFKTKFKQDYSNISQATELISNENHGTFKGLCSADWDNDCLRDNYKAHMITVKTCTQDSTWNVCWPSVDNGATGEITYLSGYVNSGWGYGSALMLSNGSTLLFRLSSANCTDEEDTDIPVCGSIWVDVNGLKAPNIVGRDEFMVYILPNSTIVPYGTYDSFSHHYNEYCDSKNLNIHIENGSACATNVLTNNDY